MLIMKLTATKVLLGAALATTSWISVESFRPMGSVNARAVNGVSATSLKQSSTAASTPCDMPDVTDIPEGVTANVLRSAVLTDVNGNSVKLGDKMGSGTSIVIFLRHLG